MRGTSSFQILSEKCGQQIWLAKFQLVVVRQAHFGSLRIALEHPPFVDLFRIGRRGIPLLCWIVAGYMPWSDSQNGSLNWSQHSIVNADLLSSTQMDGPHQIWLKDLVFVLSPKKQTSPEFWDSRQWALEVCFSRCCQGAFVWRTASISFSCALDEFGRKTLPEDVVDHKTWWIDVNKTMEKTSGIFYIMLNQHFSCIDQAFLLGMNLGTSLKHADCMGGDWRWPSDSCSIWYTCKACVECWPVDNGICLFLRAKVVSHLINLYRQLVSYFHSPFTVGYENLFLVKLYYNSA